MVFHWQSDLAPKLKDSWVSRFLITTIPSAGYVYNGETNITLQRAAQHICNSLAGLKLEVPNLEGQPVAWCSI